VLNLDELRRAVPLLESLLNGHRVRAIAQPEVASVVFSTYGGGSRERSGEKHHLVWCCGSGVARVGLLERAPAALPAPPAFTQYLRAHVSNAEIAGFRLIGGDRQLAMRLRTRDGDYDVLLAIFGHRSNVVLLDASSRVLVAMRPLAGTRRDVALGGEWTTPASRPPTSGGDRFGDVSDADFLRAIETFYAATRAQDERDTLRRDLERAFRRELKAYDRKLAKIAQTLAEASLSAGLEREGELLKGVLAQVKRGDTEVVARDFTSGEAVTIALDPSLSPADNLEHLFKRFRKAVRGLAKAGAQQAEVCAARDAVAALAAEVPADASELSAFAERPELRRLLSKYTPKQPSGPSAAGRSKTAKIGKRSVPLRLVPRRYCTAAGLEVWVGRSDEGNDFLTTRLASGNDLFFHLDGAPGSHVILRCEGRSDPPSEAVLDACELAVHYSKAKNATRADVHVVPIKNVKKPKGAKPGLVMVHGGKTIHLRRIQTRLERILAARIENGD
jgi:predicted ribosome quality control (RQC) complex YloA/Tae2 family protein